MIRKNSLLLKNPRLTILLLVLGILALLAWFFNIKDNKTTLPQSQKPHVVVKQKPSTQEIKKTVEEMKDMQIHTIKKQISQIVQNQQMLTPNDCFKLGNSYQFGKYGLKQDFQRAVAYYQRSLEGYSRTRDTVNSGMVCLHLGRLYKNGGGDTPPDAERAIGWFKRALSHGYEDGFLDIADIYMHGLHPFYLPNKVVAGQIYHVINSNASCSKQLKAIARQRINDISSTAYMDMDTIPEQDGRQYRPLPYDIIQDLYDITSTSKVPLIQTSSPSHIVQAAMQEEEMGRRANEVLVDIDEVDVNLQEMLWADLTERHRRENQRTEGQLQGVVIQEVQNDAQNVHSSTVQKGASQKIDFIAKNETRVYKSTTAKSDFLAEVQAMGGVTPTQKANIEKVLNSMKDVVHSRYDKSENDIFALVWGRINDPVNKDRRDDMVKVLAQNMESAVEHGHVVCSTGKIVRTIGSLDGLDKAEENGDMPILKPEWVLEKELAEVAAKIRSEKLDAAPEDVKKAYEAANPNDDERDMANTLSKEMREEFRRKCMQDYVNKNLMSEDSLLSKIDVYLENL